MDRTKEISSILLASTRSGSQKKERGSKRKGRRRRGGKEGKGEEETEKGRMKRRRGREGEERTILYSYNVLNQAKVIGHNNDGG